MTKQELIQCINASASAFLGFQTQMAGLSSKNKACLETMAAAYERMVELRQKAEKVLGQYSNIDRLGWDFYPDQKPEEVTIAEQLAKQALTIWDTRF